MDAVYVENLRGAVWLERPKEIQHYTEVFERMRRRALSPDESTEFMANLISSL